MTFMDISALAKTSNDQFEVKQVVVWLGNLGGLSKCNSNTIIAVIAERFAENPILCSRSVW